MNRLRIEGEKMSQQDRQVLSEGEPASLLAAQQDAIQTEAHCDLFSAANKVTASYSNVDIIPLPQSENIPELPNLGKGSLKGKSYIDGKSVCDEQEKSLNELDSLTVDCPLPEKGKSPEIKDNVTDSNSSVQFHTEECLANSSISSNEQSSPDVSGVKRDLPPLKEALIKGKQIISTLDSSLSSIKPPMTLSKAPSPSPETNNAETSKKLMMDETTDSVSHPSQSTSSMCRVMETHDADNDPQSPSNSCDSTDAQIRVSFPTSQNSIPTLTPSSSSPSTSALQPPPPGSNEGGEEARSKMVTTAPEGDVLDNVKTEILECDEESDAEDEISDSYEGQVSTTTVSRDEDGACKVLTKYIFVGRPKPPKGKVAKKKPGLLYTQAFRHFQRPKGKMQSPMKNYLAVLEKNFSALKGSVKKEAKSPEKKAVKAVEKTRKRKLSDSMEEKSKKYKKGGKKEEKKNSQAVKKKSQKKSPVKTEKTTNRRKSQRKKKEKISLKFLEDSDTEHRPKGKKSKSKKKKYLSKFEKIDIINAFESPSASLSSIAKKFNVDTSTVARVLKEKDKILTGRLAKEKKIKKAKAKKTVAKSRGTKSKLLDIKEETLDPDEVEDNDADREMDIAEDNSHFSHGLSSTFATGISGKGKSRKELTIQEKTQMIRELEQPGVKVKHLAKKYGVSTSAVGRVRRHKDHILSRSLSGDICTQMRRVRNCKDPVLDKALLKWYRAVEGLQDRPICITNCLLQDKARDMAVAMGRSYFPTANWIIRWKYRHNIRCKSGRIESKEELDELDSKVDMADIITSIEGQGDIPMKTERDLQMGKSEKMLVCEHCGVMTNRRRDRKRNNHLKTCPSSSLLNRRDLTLGEKAQVVRSLEIPGIKMVQLAKKYGVSSSSISRIHKNRVEILALCASTYVNVRRKRYRESKEPEVERALCDWYRQQQEYGYHVSSANVREKAHEIAAQMGKQFWPSESWVFRWRHRNNFGRVEETKDEEDEQDTDAENQAELEEMVALVEEGKKEKREKRKRKREKVKKEPAEKLNVILPKSVMCEKCGCVSERMKNNRISHIKHAKGCPDLKPRNELTYQERIKMLKALEEPGATLSSVARQFGISASSMSRMNQRRSSIMVNAVDYGNHKRVRDCKEPEVAKLLYDWFLEKQREGIHVTGVKLKEKAAILAREMGREFKASTGWVGRWKHRYNLILHEKDEKKPARAAVPKKRVSKKKAVASFKREEVTESPEENHEEEMNPAEVVPVVPEDTAQMVAPARGVFLNQRYQNPWAINHQASSSTARPKEFMPVANQGVPEESHVPYPYDPMSRHMLHNVFENFTSAAAGYPVSVVDASVPVRDYLQSDGSNAHQPSPTHHHLISHQPSTLNLHTAGIPQPHQHPAPPPPPPPQHSVHDVSHSPAPPVHDGDSLMQQQQIMEACKLVNSFAKEKSLGEHVQAALRTIEMTLKSGELKGHSRNSYTNI